MRRPGTLDEAWLRAHPLPSFEAATDKNSRGQLLLVGGAPMAPAALLLTGEAAFRAGCGKVQLGVAERMAPVLAAALPEAGMIALPVDAAGDIAADAAALLEKPIARADAVVIGCGTGHGEAVRRLTAALIDRPREALAILLDAGACAAAAPLAPSIRAHAGRLVLSPHPGEMAALLARDTARVAAAPEEALREAIDCFGAVVALRGRDTLIGAPDGRLLHYAGGGIGLATGGSGDVGAGLIGGLLARGADPFVAAAWATWLHGEAGRRLGAPGYLARELLPLIRDLRARAGD